MDKKVSVIIPVYKAEAYLGKCIDSVLCQTYKNLEIILIDDGSPDNCPALCDSYAEKDSRVKVFHKQNGGTSTARNAGLDICTGEYITFIDSDDFVSADYVEALVYGLEAIGADLSVTDYSMDKPLRDLTKSFEVKGYLGREALGIYCGVGGREGTAPFYVMACMKLYKRSLFGNLRFPEGRLYEDDYIAPQIYYRTQKCAHIAGERYFYFQHPNSQTKKKTEKVYLDVLSMFVDRIQFFAERNEQEYVNATIDRFVGQCLSFYTELYKNKEMSKILDGYIKKYFVKENYGFFRKNILRAGKLYKFSKSLFRIAFNIKKRTK